MGAVNSQKNTELYSVLKPINWQKQYYLGQGELVRDIQSGLKGELYNISINNIQLQIPIYQFRKDNPHYIVTVHSVEQATQKFLCSTSESVRVVTERIPFRLSDLGNIGYAEGLYILQCALKGAQLINNRYLFAYSAKNIDQSARYVQYTENNICFTEVGEAKIWVNEALAYNAPPVSQSMISNSKNILEALNIERRTAQQIMGLIQSRMNGNKFNNYLRVKKQQFEELIDFENCIDFVLRMRAIQQGQSQTVRNIILPSMLMKSMSQSNNEQKKDYQQKSFAQSRFGNSNTITQRINNNNIIQNPMERMQNTITSTSSVSAIDIDINKYAIPPRPPKKNSRSKSKQRPISKNASQEKLRPNIPTNLLNNTNFNMNNELQNSSQGQMSTLINPVIDYSHKFHHPQIITSPNHQQQLNNQPQAQLIQNSMGGQYINQGGLNPSIQPTKNPFWQNQALPKVHPVIISNSTPNININSNMNQNHNFLHHYSNGSTDCRPINQKISLKPRSPFNEKKHTNTLTSPPKAQQLQLNAITVPADLNSPPNILGSPKIVKKYSANVVNFSNTNPKASNNYYKNNPNNDLNTNTNFNVISQSSPSVKNNKGIQSFESSTKPIVTFNTASNGESGGIFRCNEWVNKNVNMNGTQKVVQLKKNSSQSDNNNNKSISSQSKQLSPSQMLQKYNNKYGINLVKEHITSTPLTNSNTNNINNKISQVLNNTTNNINNIINSNTYNNNNNNNNIINNNQDPNIKYSNTSLTNNIQPYHHTNITFNHNKVNFTSTPIYSYPNPTSPYNHNNGLYLSNTNNTANKIAFNNNIGPLPMHYTHIPQTQIKVIQQKINTALNNNRTSPSEYMNSNNLQSPLNTSIKMNINGNNYLSNYTSMENINNPKNAYTSTNTYMNIYPNNNLTHPTTKNIQMKRSQVSNYSIQGSIEQI